MRLRTPRVSARRPVSRNVASMSKPTSMRQVPRPRPVQHTPLPRIQRSPSVPPDTPFFRVLLYLCPVSHAVPGSPQLSQICIVLERWCLTHRRCRRYTGIFCSSPLQSNVVLCIPSTRRRGYFVPCVFSLVLLRKRPCSLLVAKPFRCRLSTTSALDGSRIR